MMPTYESKIVIMRPQKLFAQGVGFIIIITLNSYAITTALNGISTCLKTTIVIIAVVIIATRYWGGCPSALAIFSI